MIGFIGKLFTAFLGAVAALAGVGWLQSRRDAKTGKAPEKVTFFSEEEVGNVSNLNDRFNRARYMDKDGK